MPIILERQRALSRVGKIRMGERKQPNRPGFQRDTFRFTSANKAALEMLHAAYGGKLEQWPDHPGEWELDSEAGQISCVVDTTLSVDENFERYDGKTRSHLCNGVTCRHIAIERGTDNKIKKCVDRGKVACLCSTHGEGPDPNNKSHCYLQTTLRVILPATGDIVLWEFASKGAIFNKEVFAAIDSFRLLGIRQGYCHLTINRLEKTVGNEVSKWGTARLTLDPNPPNMVAALLARTPEAQARAILAGAQVLTEGAAGLAAPTRELPPPTSGKKLDTESPEGQAKLWLSKDLGMELDAFRDFCAHCDSKEPSADWIQVALGAKAKEAKTVAELYRFADTGQVDAFADEKSEGLGL